MSKNKAAAPTQEQKIKNLRSAIMEGEASGPATAFNMDEFLASKRENPFAAFTEWSSEAEERAYSRLRPADLKRRASMKKSGIEYAKCEMGNVRIVKDFLPPPSQLALRDDNVKVTLSLSRRSIDFFKREAKKQRVPYQKLIRTLVPFHRDYDSLTG
jgi:Bacterial antitoxin of ParD toxin-antitoxin type II system and RHH